MQKNPGSSIRGAIFSAAHDSPTRTELEMITILVDGATCPADDRTIVMALQRANVPGAAGLPMRLGLLNDAGELYRIVACGTLAERAKVIEALAQLSFHSAELEQAPMGIQMFFARDTETAQSPSVLPITKGSNVRA